MEAVAIVNRKRERGSVRLSLSLPKGSSGQIMQGLILGERQSNILIDATKANVLHHLARVSQTMQCKTKLSKICRVNLELNLATLDYSHLLLLLLEVAGSLRTDRQSVAAT